MNYNSLQYRDEYLRQLKQQKEDIDKLIAEKKESGNIDITELNQLQQQRILSPLFNDTVGYSERFRAPW